VVPVKLMEKPPIANLDEPAPVCAGTPRPMVKQRTVAPTAPILPGAAATEFKSKFRWDVDVGHYLWSGAGASKPMNVNWGKKGATSSTPIVVNNVVTVEPGAGPAVGNLGLAGKLPEKRCSCRPSMTPRALEASRAQEMMTPSGEPSGEAGHPSPPPAQRLSGALGADSSPRYARLEPDATPGSNRSMNGFV